MVRRVHNRAFKPDRICITQVMPGSHDNTTVVLWSNSHGDKLVKSYESLHEALKAVIEQFLDK